MIFRSKSPLARSSWMYFRISACGVTEANTRSGASAALYLPLSPDAHGRQISRPPRTRARATTEAIRIRPRPLRPSGSRSVRDEPPGGMVAVLEGEVLLSDTFFSLVCAGPSGRGGAPGAAATGRVL